MLPTGNCARVLQGMGEADRAIRRDIHRHHRRGWCRLVVDHEIRAEALLLGEPADIANPLP